MTFTFNLERPDGMPADPPSFRRAVPGWRVRDTIPMPTTRNVRSRLIVVSKDGEPSALVVEDLDANGTLTRDNETVERGVRNVVCGGV
jgi:hypothetical protein